MTLIARKEAEPIKPLSVRLPERLLGLVDAYAQQVNGDHAYVISGALQRLFEQDREFAEADGLTAPRRARPAAEG